MLSVAPTGAHHRRGEFVCVVAATTAEERGLRHKRLALVTRAPSDGFVLTAICRVLVDASVPGTTVRIDHTLRRALAFDDTDDITHPSVEVWPLRRPWRSRFADMVARQIGVQYVHFRVYRTDIIDAEKNVCRVPAEAFPLLGCGEGDVVVCESAGRGAGGDWELRRIRLRALAGPDLPPVDVDPRPEIPLIGHLHDLRPLRIDLQARAGLAAAVQSSVRVRRDVRRRLMNLFRDFGIASLLSLFATSQVIEAEGLARAGVVGGVILTVIGLLYWKVRGELP